MLEAARHKRMYALHEWSGLLFGLFLFMVAFTGTVAVFHDELEFWEAPELRTAAAAGRFVPAEDLVDGYLATLPQDTEVRSLFLTLPAAHRGAYSLFVGTEVPGATEGAPSVRENREVHWNAATGVRLDERGHGLAHWLRDIHRDLMLPNRTIGRFLVGLAGIVMLVSIVTGVLTHSKILKELFTLRAGRSRRLQWKDTHNVLGAWALPFHAMIAFSGAYLGVVVILLPIFAFAAFKGDQDAAIEAVLGTPREAAGIAAEPVPLSRILRSAERATGYEATGARLEHHGDANGLVEVFLHPADRLHISTAVRVDAVTGEGADQPVAARGGFEETGAEAILGAMTALHYATYGGAWLKILYVGLGLALCVLIATGLMVWVERRAHGPTGSLSRETYLRIGRFNTGFMMGLPIATASVFYADRLTSATGDDRIDVVGGTYLGVWALVTCSGALLADARRFLRASLVVAGTLAIGVLPLDGMTLGNGSLADPAQRVALGLDLGLALLGGLAVFVGLGLDRLPAARNAAAGGQGPEPVYAAPRE